MSCFDATAWLAQGLDWLIDYTVELSEHSMVNEDIENV